MARLPPEDDWGFDEEREEPRRRRWLVLSSLPDAREPPRASGPPARAKAVAGRLLAAAAVFVALGVLVGELAGGMNAGAADRAYLAKLALPARDSQAVGAQLATLLSRTTTMAKLDSALMSLGQRQQRDTGLASTIDPPAKLRSVQRQAIDALLFRDNGLAGLLAAFRDAAANPKHGSWAEVLAAEASRLVTSDVIWRDLVQAPAHVQLTRDGLVTARVPDSMFITDLSQTSAESMAAVLARLNGITTRSPSTPTILKLGATGSAVTTWQRQLNTWLTRQSGATAIAVDGKYGQSTLKATQQFQTTAHLTADGEAGPATRAALRKALGA